MLTTAKRKRDMNSHLVPTHTVPSGWRNNKRNGTEGAPDGRRCPRWTAGSQGSVYYLKDGVTFTSFQTLDDRETQESKETLNPGEIMAAAEGRNLQACWAVSILNWALIQFKTAIRWLLGAQSSSKPTSQSVPSLWDKGGEHITLKCQSSLNNNNIHVQAHNGVKHEKNRGDVELA